ncbi:NADPH-dependent FMN reductase [Thalassotalea aquiviva]|uniref:NADPH-dependent FMN reductase n=1 Tax=Thalassotalea aquiviva TaxID=3242415 RepID=UPI00352B658A
MTKILAFSGSSRKGSLNQQMVSIAARGAQAKGADVTVINLADFDMPIFCQDFELEYGMPEKAQDFKELLLNHNGMLIASPEYNGSYSALLKNALDWASRANSADEVPLSAFKGKFAMIMSTTPNPLGGIQGLANLRILLTHLGVTVCPDQVAIGQEYSAFVQGKLVDEFKHKQVLALGESLHQLLTKLV